MFVTVKSTRVFSNILPVLGLALALILFLPSTSSEASNEITLEDLAEVMPELRQAMDSVRIRKNPGQLQNSVLSDKVLPRLLLKGTKVKNGTIKNCLLPEWQVDDVVFENFNFENVIISNAVLNKAKFVNCTFADVFIVESVFSDCQFTGGGFIRKKYNSHGGRPDFDKNEYRNTVFDQTAFEGGFFFSNCEGSMTFRNIENPDGSTAEGRYFVHGFSLQLKLDNCNVSKLDFLSAWRDSRITVKNSSFRGSRFWTGSGSLISFEKCSFTGDTGLDCEGTVLLMDCTAKTGVKTGSNTKLDIKGGSFAQ